MDSYSNTHDPMSRSVAAISDGCTCNLSSPRNESGIRGSGGIFENRGDEMTDIGGLESGETRRPDEFLRTLTRPDERPCGTWSWSASNARGGGDSRVSAPVVSEVDSVGLCLAAG